MLNKELISASIPTLTLNDSIFQALELMSEFHITQLAVVGDEKYLGLVFEEDLMNVDNTALLQSINNHFSKIKSLSFFLRASRSLRLYLS